MLIYTSLILWCIALVSSSCKNDVEIICYWGSWSSYRPDIGKFTTLEIDPKLCTRIIYCFAGLNKNLEIQSLDDWNDISLGGYSNITSLKKDNPCLKVNLALGGWNEGSIKYSVMASTEESRKAFAKNALKYLVYYDFDGIDIDWEYPTGRGGIKQDKENFVAFLKAVKDAVSPWGLTVSTAVSIEDGLVGTAYDVAGIASAVDFVHLMAYDYITTTSSVTGLSSPMSAIKNTVNQWLQNGIPSKKLILGIPSYARAFKLKDPASNGIGAPTMGVAEPGPYTMEAGFMAYYEILDLKSLDKFNEVESDDTIYAYCNYEWYTYENEKSVQTKVKFALNMNLGGVMLWSLDTDDFQGLFGNKYPLLTAVNDIVHNINT